MDSSPNQPPLPPPPPPSASPSPSPPLAEAQIQTLVHSQQPQQPQQLQLLRQDQQLQRDQQLQQDPYEREFQRQFQQRLHSAATSSHPRARVQRYLQRRAERLGEANRPANAFGPPVDAGDANGIVQTLNGPQAVSQASTIGQAAAPAKDDVPSTPAAGPPADLPASPPADPPAGLPTDPPAGLPADPLADPPAADSLVGPARSQASPADPPPAYSPHGDSNVFVLSEFIGSVVRPHLYPATTVARVQQLVSQRGRRVPRFMAAAVRARATAAAGEDDDEDAASAAASRLTPALLRQLRLHQQQQQERQQQQLEQQQPQQQQPQQQPPRQQPPQQQQQRQQPHQQQQQLRMAEVAAAIRTAQAAARVPPRLPPAATARLLPVVFDDPDTDADRADAATGHSPICIRTSTAVQVRGDRNILYLDASPADQANAVAAAVFRAIGENSTSHCGIPMIDEDGRPRPIRIEVDAGVLVEGAGNVVGGRDVVGAAETAAAAARSRDEQGEILVDAAVAAVAASPVIKAEETTEPDIKVEDTVVDSTAAPAGMFSSFVNGRRRVREDILDDVEGERPAVKRARNVGH